MYASHSWTFVAICETVCSFRFRNVMIDLDLGHQVAHISGPTKVFQGPFQGTSCLMYIARGHYLRPRSQVAVFEAGGPNVSRWSWPFLRLVGPK